MASSFCSSTRILRRVLCALLDPNSTPSGTITAAAAAGLEQAQEECDETAARSSSS